jgi:hypothetical protein
VGVREAEASSPFDPAEVIVLEHLVREIERERDLLYLEIQAREEAAVILCEMISRLRSITGASTYAASATSG